MPQVWFSRICKIIVVFQFKSFKLARVLFFRHIVCLRHSIVQQSGVRNEQAIIEMSKCLQEGGK